MAAQTLKIWRGIHPLIKVAMGVIAIAVLGFVIWLRPRSFMIGRSMKTSRSSLHLLGPKLSQTR